MSQDIYSLLLPHHYCFPPHLRIGTKLQSRGNAAATASGYLSLGRGSSLAKGGTALLRLWEVGSELLQRRAFSTSFLMRDGQSLKPLAKEVRSDFNCSVCIFDVLDTENSVQIAETNLAEEASHARGASREA